MTQDQLEQIKKSIDKELRAGIETHVNGKIRHLSDKLDNYIEADELWKKRAEPVILLGQNVSGFGKVSLYIVGFVSAVAGAILVIFKFIQK